MFRVISKLALGPAIVGLPAIVFAAAAVAVPTALRTAVDAYVDGTAVTGFVPFVILSAVFLCWKYAAGVAIASAAIGDALFIGPPNKFLEGPSDIYAVSAFLLASMLVIGSVEGFRRHAKRVREIHTEGIVFSLKNGQAWASWYGHEDPVHLGPQEEVAEMMEDFLAQVRLGKRLAAGQADI